MKPRKSILKGLLKDPLARSGIILIALASIIAIGGAYLRPDSSQYANEQHLALARSKPLTKVTFLEIPKDKGSRSGLFKGFLFGGLASAEERYPYDSYEHNAQELIFFYESNEIFRMPERSLSLAIDLTDTSQITKTIEQMSSTHTFILGTDSFGRDMLSRLMAGSLVSLSVGLISVLISLLIGVTLGAIAGYYRTYVDSLIMWLINVIWSIPTLLMVIAITLVMGKGFMQVFIAVGLTMWVEVARIVRGQFLTIREQPYLEAGKSMGYSPKRLIFKHMLPNAMGPVIVISAANFASAILIEAGLSFLGIGTQIPMPSWGGMIKEHYAYITTDMAYLAILPGLCITLLVLSFMLIGNRLRDILDVQTS